MNTPDDPSPTDMTVDLTNCDREPIHILGRVQSFGALVSVTPDWIINHASLNLAEMLGSDVQDQAGLPLTDVFSDEAIHTLRSRLQMLRSPDAIERVFAIQLTDSPQLFDVALHRSHRSIIIEIERHTDGAGTDYVGFVRPMIDRVRGAKTLEEVCRTAARQFRALVGFDRVMVYKFAPDRSGQVIAEAGRPDLEDGYLNLRFPASDIPKQAFDLYKRSLLRIISDVDDPGVEIQPVLSAMGEPLDMSMGATRWVSPVHLEYLRNMGVKASMSASIIVKGELWGLFSCHHESPRILGYDIRTAAELFAQLFAFALSEFESEQQRVDTLRARILHDQLMGQIAEGSNIEENFEAIAHAIGTVIPFDGAVTWVEGKFQSFGKTPTREEFERLSRVLNTAAVSQVFTTESIKTLLPEASDYAERASGLLALPISRSPRDYLVLFRQEMKQSVEWAGNPDKPVEFGPNGARLSPRKSFESWQETLSGHASPWTETEKLAAESLRVTLLEVVLRMTDAQVRERNRAQQQQELLIAELNHRVRNILNLIRGLINQSDNTATVEDFTKTVGGRVHALSRAHDQITRENWSPASLYELIETEASAYLGDKADRIVLTGPDAMLSPAAFTTLSLVIHEMMTNAAKYGALVDGRGRIEIQLRQGNDKGLHLSWREIGGPPVTAPTRRGFGTTIIERSIPYELDGRSEIAYDVTGVTFEAVVPSDFIDRYRVPVAKTAEVSVKRTDTVKPIQGDVMVVEDNMIIALDAEDILRGFGAQTVHVASTVAEAMRIADTETLQFALLDVNLGNETSEPIAEHLRTQGVPFAFATGYGERTTLAERFEGVPIIQKPFDSDSIGAVVKEL